MATIAIVDDSLTVRTQLRKALEDASYNVIEAVDGSDGFHKIVNLDDLDLLILDYNMPEVDGLAMLQRLIEHRGMSRFPVIMLTTESSQQLKDLGKKLGVIAWVIKPLQAEKLLTAIRKILLAREKLSQTQPSDPQKT